MEAPDEIDVDDHVDAKGIRYIGTATRQKNGTYIALADVNGCLCRVECRIVIKDDGLETYWLDLKHQPPPEHPTATPMVYPVLYADDAHRLLDVLRHEQTVADEAGNAGMVDVLRRVEAALIKAGEQVQYGQGWGSR